MGKYFHVERAKDSYVYLRLMNNDGKVFHDFGRIGCHGAIAGTMDTRTATINVYRNKSLMPYNVSEIKRWIADLNEMGFICEFVYDESGISDEVKQNTWAKDTVNKDFCDFALSMQRHGGPAPVDPTQFYNFYVHLKDYVNKSHMFSTLQLIRCLYESNLNKVPEMYFERVDATPGADKDAKFQILQDCHKGPINGYSHAVTFNGNGKNIALDAIMKRFKEKTDLYNSRLAINQAWNGGSV